MKRFNGNKKLVKSLVATFRADCPKKMSSIRTALGARDATALAEAAHALKGAVGNFGPTTAFETARQIELTARGGTLEGCWELYTKLEDEIASLLPALQDVGEKTKGKARPRGRGRSRRKG